MPTISRFYGIKIRMYNDEHGVTHFHAKYAEYEAVFNADTCEIIVGELPTAQQKLVEAWAVIHHKELLKNGLRITQGEKLHKIEGLK